MWVSLLMVSTEVYFSFRSLSAWFFMSIIPLQKFIKSVPVCAQTDSLEAVRSIFSQGTYDRIAIVNEQQHPLGLVYLRNFILLLPVPGRWEPNWQQPLSELDSLRVEPLTVVPASLSLRDFWAYLREHWQVGTGFNQWLEPTRPPASASAPTPIGLVDRTGQFVGLLDSLRLLQFLALNDPGSGSRPENRNAPGSTPELELLGARPIGNQRPAEPRNASPSEHSVFRQNSELASSQPIAAEAKFLTPASSCGGSESAGTVLTLRPLNLLVQLLEQLPLPLMLQNSTGQIITQNLAWRSIVGTGPDPAREAVKAATRARWEPKEEAEADEFPRNTESPYLSPQTTHPRDSTLPGSSVQVPGQTPLAQGRPASEPIGRQMPTPGHHSENPIEPAASVCRLGAKPDTYICASPSQTGGERVWYLMKQPLMPTSEVSDTTGNPPPELWLVFAQDVTEQELVAKELAAKNADLIQLNRLKDEFLACISHELKTPLTAILGLSSLLQDRVLGELSDRQTRYAKLIHQSGRHLMAVVNDILDLTRMETGQLDLLLEPVQLRAVCERAFEMALRLQTPEDKPQTPAPPGATGDSTEQPQPTTKFTLEIEPGLTKIEADELRLRQMLVNLLSNALKFTESGGEIGLKVSRWEAWIAFTVWDTGIGIPPDKQHLIFQKFQQLESPLTRRFQGTGLGLVLTQRLARLHGGDVSFISKEGEGSQFTLLLPPSPPEPGAESGRVVSDRPVPHPRSRLVLIVEAVPKFIEDLSNLLAGLGYQVVIARSGTEALEKARRFSPEVIFLNPLLPLLSGWDVLTLLKTDPDTHQIPAIVTATRGDKDRASLNRADGFLSLPVKEVALRQQLDDLRTAHDPTSPPLRASLTILWLSPAKLATSKSRSEEGSVLSSQVQAEIEPLIHPATLLMPPCHYRVLEADDLDQAELIARIWQPDVMILESASLVGDPATFVQEFSQRLSLAALPLVTLDQATTQAANLVQGLSVFPYLAAPGVVLDGGESGVQPMPSALLEVIQVAAGMSWKPTILAVDLSTLPDLPQPLEGNSPPLPLSPMIQYLERAGFQGSIGHSWAEVLQQLQYQSVDLLLICLRDEVLGVSCPQEMGFPCPPAIGNAEGRLSSLMPSCELYNRATPAAIQAFSTLGKMVVKPPIVVLDQRVCREGEVLNSMLQKIATNILPSSVSMAELLGEIKHILKRK